MFSNKVVSLEIDLTRSLFDTIRASWPFAKNHKRSPIEPNFFAKSFLSHLSKSLKVRIPAFSNDFCAELPTPHINRTDLSFKKEPVSASPIIEYPFGLLRSEAIFAKNLLCDSPIDPVKPNFPLILSINFASITAGGTPCNL